MGDGVTMQCGFCHASSLVVALERACVLGVWTGFTGETVKQPLGCMQDALGPLARIGIGRSETSRPGKGTLSSIQ